MRMSIDLPARGRELWRILQAGASWPPALQLLENTKHCKQPMHLQGIVEHLLLSTILLSMNICLNSTSWMKYDPQALSTADSTLVWSIFSFNLTELKHNCDSIDNTDLCTCGLIQHSSSLKLCKSWSVLFTSPNTLVIAAFQCDPP